MSTDDAAPPPQGWWHCRTVRPDGTVSAFYVVRSTLHADGVRVDLPQDEAMAVIGDDAQAVVRYGTDGTAVTVRVMPAVAPKAPLLWFADLPEPAAQPPAMNLVAFTGQDVPEGTLKNREALQEVGVASDDQLGALRWYPATGEIDQIYVNPKHRRRTIASALLMAGGTLHVARGGTRRMWADGQRTADGDRLRNGRAEWAHRADDLTHLAPPMTPFDQR